MSNVEDSKTKKELLKQLKNIKGHVGGIEKMVEKEKACGDLLIQISAVKSALNKIGVSLIKNNVSQCILESIEEDEEKIGTNKEKLKKSIDEAVENILKFD